MKKIILMLMIGMFLISSASAASSSLGIFKQGECINLIQTCSDCTYNNISSILSPTSSTMVSDVSMTKDDTYYNYTFCLTDTIGIYQVNGYGDDDGTKDIWVYDFEVTPSGLADMFDFYIIILLIAGVLIVFGFWIKDPWIVIFGTFGLYFVGLYIMLNGIVGIKDMVTTWAIAIIILGVAGYISFKSALEVVNG